MPASAIPIEIKSASAPPTRGRSVRRLLRDRLALLTMAVLLTMTLVCLFGPPIVEGVFKVDPNRIHIDEQFAPPGAAHILGTDQYGRDQLIRLLVGGQVSLAIAYSASIISIVIGLTVGLLAGDYGGLIEGFGPWFVHTVCLAPTDIFPLVA